MKKGSNIKFTFLEETQNLMLACMYAALMRLITRLYKTLCQKAGSLRKFKFEIV